MTVDTIPAPTTAERVVPAVVEPPRKPVWGRRAADGVNLLQIGLAVAVAVLTVVGLPEDSRWPLLVSDIGMPLALFPVVVLMVLTLRRLPAVERRAWGLITAGIAASFLGEVAWSVVELGLGREPVSPGPHDLFELAAYPLITLGILGLPHLTGSRYSAARVSLDALVGSVAFAVLLWDQSVSDLLAEADLSAERVMGFAYPLLDVFVMAAIIIALLRRSPYRRDPRLAALLIALGFALAADVAFPVMEHTTGYSAGDWPDALWVLGYAMYGVTAWHLRRPAARREVAMVRPSLWKLLVPYTWVLGVFGLFFWRVLALDLDSLALLSWTALGITAAVIARQAISIRETREMVEAERDQLLASLSHELRTPLTAVAGFSDIMDDDWDAIGDDEKRELVSIIRSQANHLSHAVVDMVALARNNLDEIEIRKSQLDGKQLIADAIRAVFDVNSGPLPVKARVEPFLAFSADRNRLLQILVHLLSNAQRYGNGHILIVARRDGDDRLLEVHDDGPGVTLKYEHLIWERFERGEHRLNASIPGSGLGLSIVKALSEAHGGTAGYRRSEELGGACFWVELPF
jgi:signal transduction histidine kinase